MLPSFKAILTSFSVPLSFTIISFAHWSAFLNKLSLDAVKNGSPNKQIIPSP
jgi:hypothetical protein